MKLGGVWVRILGIASVIWSQKISKSIEDKCGGWFETDEETTLRNHLKWARIKVKGPSDQISKQKWSKWSNFHLPHTTLVGPHWVCRCCSVEINKILVVNFYQQY